MATATYDARSETYADVEKLIYKLAYKFAAKYDVAADEATSVGNEAFLKAYDDYDPSRGVLFGTMLHHYVWNALRDWQRSERIRAPHYYADENIADYADPALEFDLDGFSDDGRHVAELAMNVYTAKETDMYGGLAARAKAKGGAKNNWRSTIREYLLGLGWAATRVAESFEEIRKALEIG